MLKNKLKDIKTNMDDEIELACNKMNRIDEACNNLRNQMEFKL